jgi:hypothetical protein
MSTQSARAHAARNAAACAAAAISPIVVASSTWTRLGGHGSPGPGSAPEADGDGPSDACGAGEPSAGAAIGDGGAEPAPGESGPAVPGSALLSPLLTLLPAWVGLRMLLLFRLLLLLAIELRGVQAMRMLARSLATAARLRPRAGATDRTGIRRMSGTISSTIRIMSETAVARGRGTLLSLEVMPEISVSGRTSCSEMQYDRSARSSAVASARSTAVP